MTELDLGLKVATRKLFWKMGFSTRIDVPLRTLVPDDARGRARSPETFTDLDVLGVTLGPGFRPRTIIADCKSGTRSRTGERLFWLRGVAELFDADDAWVVQENIPPAGARQLASRLGITVLTTSDLPTLDGYHTTDLPLDHPTVARLFDRGEVESYLKAFVGLSKRLKPLLEYRQFDYFVYEHYRNPLQVVAHLNNASKELDSKNPLHVALFVDIAWLYLLSVAEIVDHVRSTHLADPDAGIQEYVFGGQLGLKEKRSMATLLEKVVPEGVKRPEPLPGYYPQLRELVVRILRRPDHILNGLRYAEILSAGLAAKVRPRVRKAFGDAYDEIGAKLVADVCGFLVAAAELSPDFRTQTRTLLLDLGEDDTGHGQLALPTDAEPKSRARR